MIDDYVAFAKESVDCCEDRILAGQICPSQKVMPSAQARTRSVFASSSITTDGYIVPLLALTITPIHSDEEVGFRSISTFSLFDESATYAHTKPGQRRLLTGTVLGLANQRLE